MLPPPPPSQTIADRAFHFSQDAFSRCLWCGRPFEQLFAVAVGVFSGRRPCVRGLTAARCLTQSTQKPYARKRTSRAGITHKTIKVESVIPCCLCFSHRASGRSFPESAFPARFRAFRGAAYSVKDRQCTCRSHSPGMRSYVSARSTALTQAATKSTGTIPQRRSVS